MLSAPPSFRTAASALANDIRADIISGHLPPGGRLRIKELCERYGSGRSLARSPVAAGHQRFRRRRGPARLRVADVSAAELTDITDTRIHVECEALRRAIAQGGLDWGRAPGRRALPAGPGGAAAAGRQRPEPGMGTGACGLSFRADQRQRLEVTDRHRRAAARPDGALPASVGGGRVRPRRRPDATWRGSTASCWRPRWRDAVRASDLLAAHLRRTTELVLAHASRQWGARCFRRAVACRSAIDDHRVDRRFPRAVDEDVRRAVRAEVRHFRAAAVFQLHPVVDLQQQPSGGTPCAPLAVQYGTPPNFVRHSEAQSCGCAISSGRPSCKP